MNADLVARSSGFVKLESERLENTRRELQMKQSQQKQELEVEMRQIGVQHRLSLEAQNQELQEQVRLLNAENMALKQQSDIASSTHKSLKSTVSSLREQMQKKEEFLIGTQTAEDDHYKSVVSQLQAEREKQGDVAMEDKDGNEEARKFRKTGKDKQ